MKINNYKKFLESISGTELVGHMGPNYGEEENSPLNSISVDILYSDVYGRMVTYDEYQDIYFNYLKKGGSPLQGFNLENLNKVLSIVNESRKFFIYKETETDNKIMEICKDVFQDFIGDYSMTMLFHPGVYSTKFKWLSIYTWVDIKDKIYGSDTEIVDSIKENPPKSIKVTIINSHLDPAAGGRSGKFEIFLDEESNLRFKQDIESLKSHLSQEVDLIDIKYPEKLMPSHWQIEFLITYND